MLVTGKTALLERMLVKLSAVLWLFVRVTVMVLVSPMGRPPKAKLVAERTTGAKPVPERLTVCVPALSVTVSVPLKGPAVMGAKATLMVQLAPLASLGGLMAHVPPVVIAKLAVTAILVMLRAAVWPFWSVAASGALVVPSS